MQKKQVKGAGFQALANDVMVREDEYDYEDPNDCSSQNTKFGSVSIKAKRPMDKFTQRTSEKLTVGIAKTKQTTMKSKQRREKKIPLDTLGNDFMKPGFPSIPLPFLRSSKY